MLLGLLVQNFDELVWRTKVNASARRWPSAPMPGMESGIALLLAELRETPD
jgi:hypothetical protein